MSSQLKETKATTQGFYFMYSIVLSCCVMLGVVMLCLVMKKTLGTKNGCNAEKPDYLRAYYLRVYY